MNMRSIIVTLGAALACVLLQILLAPHIGIGYAKPNFLLVYVVVAAITRSDDPDYVLAFLLGFISDCLGTGPLGAMALLSLLITFLISKMLMIFNMDNLFLPLVVIVASMFIVNISYGVLEIACGMDVNLFELIVYRALPCGLYDAVLGVIAFPVALFAMASAGSARSSL